jgi:hypothetical protein
MTTAEMIQRMTYTTSDGRTNAPSEEALPYRLEGVLISSMLRLAKAAIRHRDDFSAKTALDCLDIIGYLRQMDYEDPDRVEVEQALLSLREQIAEDHKAYVAERDQALREEAE